MTEIITETIIWEFPKDEEDYMEYVRKNETIEITITSTQTITTRKELIIK